MPDSVALQRLWAVIRCELALHPGATAVDLYKLAYQAVFGSDHYRTDAAGFRAAFLAEWSGTDPKRFAGTPIVQVIDPLGATARLHLGPLKARAVSPEAVIDFLWQQPAKQGSPQHFRELWQGVSTLARRGLLPVALVELEGLVAEQAVPRHSKSYGPAAYRLIHDVRAAESRAWLRELLVAS